MSSDEKEPKGDGEVVKGNRKEFKVVGDCNK